MQKPIFKFDRCPCIEFCLNRILAYLFFVVVVCFSSIAVVCKTANAQEPQSFVVLELFTSQGCSSCPPADRLLRSISAEAKKNKLPIYALSFHVDYWNYLGWTDPYSGKNATQRQYQYARALRGQKVYTPQLVINGEEGIVGSHKKKAKKIIDNFLNIPRSTWLKLQKNGSKNNGSKTRLTIGIQYGGFGKSGASESNQLILAVVSTNEENYVPKGENARSTLSHTNVVKSLSSYPLKLNKKGSTPGAGKGSVNIDIENSKENLQLIGFIQHPITMKILGANRIDIQ